MSKIIHQIAISESSLIGYVPPNKSSIDTFFNNHQYILWDYKKIKSFILKNKDNHVLDAIDAISANAFKADIARYYIVYKLGGWYTDLNNFFVSSPPENIHELVFFRDVQELTKSSWSVQCSLFYADKGHEILKRSVDRSVENVKNKYYGGHALCPTGPNLFGSEIASKNLPENSSYLIGQMKKGKEPGFYFREILFAKYKSNGLVASNPGLPGGNSYEELWQKKELYR